MWAQQAPPENPDDEGSGDKPTFHKNAEQVDGIGIKVGEVFQDRAVLWARAAPAERPARGSGTLRRILESIAGDDDDDGEETQVRFRYGRPWELRDERWSSWRRLTSEQDYIGQFGMTPLEAGVEYQFEVEAATADGETMHETRVGRFRTAPDRDDEAPLTFTVITGQRFDRMDDPRGFQIYNAMRALNPDFYVPTGDTIYIDRGGLVRGLLQIDEEWALKRWRRMYALPYLYDFHAFVPGYWEKDDHDILQDDAYPGMEPYAFHLGERALTFERGVEILELHTPKPEKPYRSVRWGKDVEVWFTEVREFRTPNGDPDGPQKTIFGAEQKDWLKRTVEASDATWRVVVNPTPIVGPDRAEGKADNHANEAFRHEGHEIREWMAGLGENFILIAGDRHWQYHSVDPNNGLHEFGCGPASDPHAGGSPGFDFEYHRFHRMKGGFLSMTVDRERDESRATVRIHAVDGGIVHEVTRTQAIEERRRPEL